ncbi:hypothetical protein IP80_17980 [beta proteobacterium AAP65]|nr:hypothetical protein IP80_17980 [beta proteobacterium AAP65]
MDRPDTPPLDDTAAANTVAHQPMPAKARPGVDGLVIWVAVALGTVLLACGLATQALPWEAPATLARR